jgi:hypothetical protein
MPKEKGESASMEIVWRMGKRRRREGEGEGEVFVLHLLISVLMEMVWDERGWKRDKGGGSISSGIGESGGGSRV